MTGRKLEKYLCHRYAFSKTLEEVTTGLTEYLFCSLISLLFISLGDMA